MKTDITRVGTHPSGIGIHAYRYKGDPKTYPKVVGPMAEDVAKKFGPGSVAKIPGSGGKMAVHPAIMGALGAPGPAMGPPFRLPLWVGLECPVPIWPPSRAAAGARRWARWPRLCLPVGGCPGRTWGRLQQGGRDRLPRRGW